MIPKLDITILEGRKRFGNRFISVKVTVSKPFYPFQNRFGTDNNDRVVDMNGLLGTKDESVRSRSQDEYMVVLPKYARQYQTKPYFSEKLC